MSDKGIGQLVVRSARPYVIRLRTEFGDFRGVSASVLKLIHAIRVVFFDPTEQGGVCRWIEFSFVAHAVNGKGRIPAIVSVKLLKIAHRIGFESLGWNGTVIREFRLNQNASFVRRLKIFWELAMRMHARFVKSSLFNDLEVFQMEFTVGRRNKRFRIDERFAVSPNEEGKIVEIETIPNNLKFAKPKPFDPTVFRFVGSINYFDVSKIENRRFRRPELDAVDGNIDDCFRRVIVVDIFCDRKRSAIFRDNISVEGFDSDVQIDVFSLANSFDGQVNARVLPLACRFRELPLHPYVVQPSLWGRLEFDVTVKPAKFMEITHLAFAAWYVVSHVADKFDGFSGLGERSDVVFIRTAIVIYNSDWNAVDPESCFRSYSANLKPYTGTLPILRNSDELAVNGAAGIHVI